MLYGLANVGHEMLKGATRMVNLLWLLLKHDAFYLVLHQLFVGRHQ